MHRRSQCSLFIRALLVLGLLSSIGVIAHEDHDHEGEYQQQAEKLAQKYLIADTHIDVPYRLQDEWSDVTEATEGGDFDFPRAKAGGLDLVFMSIYTPAVYEEPGGHWQLANLLIDGVEALAARAPDKFTVVAEPGQVAAAKSAGKVALALGMENGSPIRTLEDVQFFHDRGIRYVTLAHSLSNAISDSSYDEARPNDGLSDFGREVVAEMNRLGIMVDVSHLSDKAIEDVLAVSKDPVIASHSSARHFTPDWERNISDELIKAVAEKGGVVHINFGSVFVTQEAYDWYNTFGEARAVFLEEQEVEASSDEAAAFSTNYIEHRPYPFANVSNVVEHIEHVIKLAGVEHVGLGSDYDGVGDSLPEGLKDVSQYPNLIAALLEKGHSESDIEKILGGNLMRVWFAANQ